MESKNKNWFAKHKVITVILVVIVLAVVFGAGSSDKKENGSSTGTNQSESSSEKEFRFADRADKQKEDIELLPNETATIDGMKMTLSDVEYKTRMSEYETAGDNKTYLTAKVKLENTSNETKAYNVFDFRVQTAGGQVLDGTFSSVETISSGDLVAGGKVEGLIIFEVPVEEGNQYVIWKPNAFNADRAVVQVK